MFAASKTATVSGATPDDKFNYVTMLLHGDGTNGAQNNTFLDSSTNNFSITRNGNTTQGSFSPYGSNWSNYFSSSSYLTFSPSTSFAFGTGDFTIEFWINTGGVNADGAVLDSTTNGSYWAIRFNGTTLYYQSASGITNLVTPTISTLSQAVWTHVAIVRASGTTKIYANGVQVSSTADSTNYTATTTYQIGKSSDNAFYTGYFSNIRVVKGTAVYTGAFTPSTTALTAISGTSLLTCQANRFFDASSNAFAITANGTMSVQRFNPFGASTAYSTSVIGGSGYFDGSGDYLNVGSSSNIDNFTGDFCIEAWIYPTVSTDQNIIARWTTGNRSYRMYLTDTTNYIRIHYNDDTINLNSTTEVKLNSWNHVVANRSGSTLSLFLNGVSVSTATSSTAIGPNAIATLIGATESASPQTFFNGYITNVRIVKNSSVYGTSSFTPPTAPLTAITNTQLLLSTINGAIFDNAMMNDLETVGNAQISTSVKKYGTGSLYFDGTGDYLLMPSSPNIAFSGDATIEFWLYVPSMPASYSQIYTSTGSTLLYIYLNSSGSIGVQAGGSYRDTTTTPISTSTWYHIAVTKTGGNVYTVYVNGTSQASSGSGTMPSSISAGAFSIGSVTSGSNYLNGYIDDFRITNGYARYTSTFTPPTSAFSDTGPY